MRLRNFFTTRRAGVRKLMHRLHSVAGSLAAVLVLCVVTTGVLAVFRDEIEWLVSAPMRVERRAALDLDAVVRGLERTFPNHTVAVVHAPRGPRFAAEARLYDEDDVWIDVLVHPGTGVVRSIRPMDGVCYATSDCLRQVHVRLLMGRTGRLVVGGIGAMLLVLLGTGAALHVGTRSRRTRKKASAQRAPMTRHRSLGYATLPAAFLLTITGTVLGLDAWLPAHTPVVPVATFARTGRTDTGAVPDEEHIRATLAEHGIDATFTRMHMPSDDEPYFTLAFTRASVFAHAGGVMVHVREDAPSTYEVEDADHADGATRAYNLLDPLHFGTLARGFGRRADLATRTVWAAFGLSMVLVTLSGMAIVVARARGARRQRGESGVYASAAPSS